MKKTVKSTNLKFQDKVNVIRQVFISKPDIHAKGFVSNLKKITSK